MNKVLNIDGNIIDYTHVVVSPTKVIKLSFLYKLKLLFKKNVVLTLNTYMNKDKIAYNSLLLEIKTIKKNE